ncbi:cobaltochelatase subunit CobN [uncultured Methanolobus sp.]|uniref:cobaltochelatase subunit CobN n=1 Tax=uncultured Methanolobus sp. TaxID=218300 RepID=UPI0029C69094|nr:cobaltochelatase subunit CobN [uncultured Methanolobus sp.]
MQIKIKSILVLSILLMAALTGVAAGTEAKTKITYIAYSEAYSENEAFELAIQNNEYSDLIEYTFIEYGNSTFGASQELLMAAESGFLGTQDVIFCDMMGDKAFNAYNATINDSFKAAKDNGVELYSIRTSSTPSYFDYVISGSAYPDPICTYYNGIDTSEEGIENAENLLMYLTMRTKITYIAYSDAYSENEALELASQSCDKSDMIEYNFIEYGNSTFGASEELRMSAESGFLGTQDVIFCDMMGDKAFNAYNATINDSFKAAKDNGVELYSIRTSSTPSYFDYVISGSAYPDPICTYYNGIDTSEEGIENAENLLMYLTMKKRLTYIAYSDAYSENEAFELAIQNNEYSDLIEYTFIEYGNSTFGASEELRMSAESGFLGTQDVIFCDMMGDKAFNAYNATINDSFKAAKDNGVELYSIRTSSTPSYFDYVISGSAYPDPICTYYNGIDTSEEGIENAENLLMYLTMKKRLTYIAYSDAYSENAALELASQSCDESDMIEYNFIEYGNSTFGASEELRMSAESGFLGTQDVIFCDMMGDKAFNAYNATINDSFKAAKDNGVELYSIRTSSTPSYFDYVVSGSAYPDPICTYYNGIDTSEEGIENAENFLMYLTMKTRITYIAYSDAYSENEALELASQSCDKSDMIEYNFIEYGNSTFGASEELRMSAESGFLGTQDVIFCDMMGDKAFNAYNATINDSFKAAKDNGVELYSIRTSSTPSYFDYVISGSAYPDPICTYYNGIDTSEEGIENAENLLTYLATHDDTFVETVLNADESTSIIGNGEVLFILGTDHNEADLINAANDTEISSIMNITVLTNNNIPTGDYNFSPYSLIFIESQDENVVEGWSSSINSSANVIGYNLSSNVTLPNVDLYSDEYTDIERYWIQGGEANMKNMLKFIAGSSSIDEPEIVLPKANLTYILSSDSSVSYMKKVIEERDVITDRFNVNVMGTLEAINSSDLSNEDVIIIHMMGSEGTAEIKDRLLEAKANGAEIGHFDSVADIYGFTTFDMETDYPTMPYYLYNNGFANMEYWIRCTGVTFTDAYIEYADPIEPVVPEDGIYHPDAFPRIFEDSEEYLQWYEGHGYDSSAPTIGIIGNKFGQSSLEFSTEDAIIRYLESQGCNVIHASYIVANEDVDIFTNDGEVLVDAIISIKGFYLNYDSPEAGVEYLQNKYNVPVLKGVTDYYQSPEQYLANVQGLSSSSIPSQVTQPEIDGLTDYIWISGRTQDPETEQYYYETLDYQVEWICDRAIAWAELREMQNADKKVTIIYYNHEGGKNNIGASYMDIGSSFTLLLEAMEEDGYDLGNVTIPNGSEFIDLFITSRNVGSWAPGELEKVIESGYVTMLPAEDYLEWYNNLPESVRTEVEDTWGEVPGEIMTYKNESGEYFVIPTIQLGNINFVPQPTRAGLSDESLIYHNESIPPTHQYLATYYWINNGYDADAMIHFGTHGTQEWLPGNEVGLWRYDYPSLMVAETPVIYPYIMDNVGEGTQAKRRGNAVIIDHLTPPIIQAGLYGELQTMHDKIHEYLEAKDDGETEMAALYRNTIIQLYDNLTMGEDLGVTTENLTAMPDNEFENFADTTLHVYLHELQDELIPYGMHVFGVAPEGEQFVTMVKSMLRDDFTEHIYDVLPKTNGTEEDWSDEADTDAMLLLNETLLNGTNVSDAQLMVLGEVNATITADLELGIEYGNNLELTALEIDNTLKALSSEYIEPGTGNDPIRNPGALPTGKNFYSFDQRTIPDEETEAMGRATMNTWLESYYTQNGEYPNKVSFILWSVETMRHEGMMEAQIYELLGVEIKRSSGRITGFDVIPEEDMTHPRIDVLLVPSGLYRDTFPYQLNLMDTAVRTVADLNETNETNYVRMNSLAIESAMLESGYNESVAEYISKSRIFSEAPGTYGTGVTEAVEASETWDNSSEIADLFFSRMSNIYGTDVWGDNYEDVFKLNLVDVDVAMHSDTSNLYGIMDNDDYYQYLGGLGLAIRTLNGEGPEMYIADFSSVDNPEIITLGEAFSKELTARYLNPNWITGMMEYDYAGAREMMKAVEHMWGWEATTPDLVTDSDWDSMYETYVLDKNNLGMEEFFKENPYQYQSVTARMLETIRKDGWDASDDTLNTLMNEYVKSVVESGVTCCHHTCGNPLLDDFVTGNMAAAGVSQQMQDAYKQLMYEATLREDFQPKQPETDSVTVKDDSLNSVQRAMASGSGSSNQTMMADSGGAGLDADTPVQDSAKSTPDNYVEGYEMTSEATTTPSEDSGFSATSSDIVASVFVLGAVGAMYVGFWRRRKF